MASPIVRQNDSSLSFSGSASPSIKTLRIKTSHIHPPIPTRSFDWSAVDDSTYDGPGSPIGRGATEQEAIDDLLEQLLEQMAIDTGIGARIAPRIGR
jgi:hypothetical protein